MVLDAADNVAGDTTDAIFRVLTFVAMSSDGSPCEIFGVNERVVYDVRRCKELFVQSHLFVTKVRSRC